MSEATFRSPPSKSRPAGNIGTGKLRSKWHRVSLSDSSEGRSQMLLAALTAFRDGDFSLRLPMDWPGTEGQIAEAFNKSIAHEDRISREVARLSVTVGKDGRLRQRMSLPGATGQWAG